MLQLSYRGGKPIYEQIKEQLRRMIVSGAIQADEKLPSIREIASGLAINPNTIQRAYRELENEGYLYTIAGKGSFAAPRQEIDTKRQQDILKDFDNAVTELLYLDYTPDTLSARINIINQKGVKHNHVKSN